MPRADLFLHDHLGGRHVLPPTRVLDSRNVAAGEPVQDDFRRGFECSDYPTDDARLAVLRARDAAAEQCSTIRPRTRGEGARTEYGIWTLILSGCEEEHARTLMNAAGQSGLRVPSSVAIQHPPTLVGVAKVHHVVAKRLFQHDCCYTLQNPNGQSNAVISGSEEILVTDCSATSSIRSSRRSMPGACP